MRNEAHIALTIGLAAAVLSFWLRGFANEGIRERMLDTCRKAHDVYACQLVAVPVPALPAATNT